ncbi:MAG: nicotinate (nicotinamide) nucleotide adenylyltransferase [Oscillospiraceae bacterium]
MSSIAIFGGTFNPIHNGHINFAEHIKNELKIDKIIIVPTKIPPHKSAANLESDNDRLNMCRLAIDGHDGFEVSDYEISRGDISYTINTLNHFKELFPKDKLYFIMGSDMFLSLQTWKKFEEILSLSTIITASREDGDLKKIQAQVEKFRQYNAEIVILSFKPYEISSTEVRNLIKFGRNYHCYLPKKIVQYISEKKLYLK